jgi:hypothetical protein
MLKNFIRRYQKMIKETEVNIEQGLPLAALDQSMGGEISPFGGDASPFKK